MGSDSRRTPTTAALLLTDVVDSTRLSQELGDDAMADLWARHDRVARDLLPLHGGREIDKTDGFLMLFQRAADAVAYAVAYHRALAALERPIRARAGVHVGPVILTENPPADVARGAKPIEVDGLAKPTAARVMSVATGGQTLATASAIAALGETSLRVQSHGHWRMKGVAEPSELFEVGDDDSPMVPPPDGAKVYRVVRSGAHWLPVSQVKHSLPGERDAFVGRDADLRELARRFDEGAVLVSVLGMGGTGKTRLATHFGWTWLGDWPGGVWFCDLSEARDVDGIASAVARGLDVPLGRGDPVTQLVHVITGRGACLVILDNFEQVARHAPDTLGPWLDRAHQARFLVTTREVLGLPGEVALPLPPLTEPEAFDLFVARAEHAKRGFTLATSDRAAVRSLVDLLDRLPLAIELAASRARVMSPAQLLERMSQRFRLLTSSGGRHERQATLRAALDWSWDLLSGDEQAALAQLSVFEGGFTLESAAGVLALEELWPEDAVQGLVDKSLVRQVGDERFDLLVSVQEYAAERLGPGRADAELRHGAWFAAFGTDEALDDLDREGGVARWRALAPEVHNLVAACRAAVGRGDADASVALLRAAWAVIGLQGPYAVATELGARLVSSVALTAGQLTRVELLLGRASGSAGQLGAARAHLEAALSLARASGDRRGEAAALDGLSGLDVDQGRLVEARDRLQAALEIGLEVGDLHRVASARGGLGTLAYREGRLEEAHALIADALARYRELRHRGAIGGAVTNLGYVCSAMGREDEARACYEEGLALHREVGHRAFETVALGNLGSQYLALGQLEAARACLESGLNTAREIGYRSSEGILLGNLAKVNRANGELDLAREQLARALAIHRDIGFGYGVVYWLSALAWLDADAGRLEEALRGAETAVETAAPYPIPRQQALSTLARVQLDLGELDAAEATLRQGAALEPDGTPAPLSTALEALLAARRGERVRAEALLAAVADALHPDVVAVAARVRALLAG